MSSQQFLPARGRARTAPVRVFHDVARTPATPAPAWWNDPVGVLVAFMVLAVVVFTVQGLPPMTGFLVHVSGAVVALGLALGRWRWATSQEVATAEAAWVAGECGYVLSGAGDSLHWSDGGRPRTARLDAGGGWWHLSLHAAPFHAPGATG